MQYAFELQWQELRAACLKHGVMLIGDLPIFVAHDSADVWANPELFYLDQRGQPLVVAGVPPDYFSETGQYWGNPLYRWDAHAADDYAWWAARLRFLLGRVDIVRIDHFRGFEAYWEIPAGSPTAASGKWVEGPGSKFFEALRRRLGHLPLIAEDLGVITPGVEALRDEFSLPGMRVLQFGFSADAGAEKHLPHRFVPHCVVYTGTHDNDTTRGWFTSTHVATTQSWDEILAERAFACRYLNTDGDGLPLGHDPPGLFVGRRHGHHPVARHSRPGQPRTDEHAGPGRGKLAMAVPEKDRSTERAHDRLAELTAVYSRWNGAIPEDLDPRFRPPKPRPGAGRAGDPPASQETSDGALNVRNQVLVLGMNFIIKNLDDVSDRNDPDELRIAHDGDLGDMAFAHLAHDIADVVIEVAGHGVAGHQLGDAQAAKALAPAVNHAHDVSFAEHPDQMPAVVDHGQRADVVLDELGDGFADGRIGIDGDDAATLILDDISDKHVAPPGYGACERSQRLESLPTDALDLRKGRVTSIAS